MTAITITVNTVGTPDEQDRRAFKLGADQENQWRASQNPPIALLPVSTAAERRTAYEAYRARIELSAHMQMIDQASDAVAANELKKRFLLATDAQQAAALAALPPLP